MEKHVRLVPLADTPKHFNRAWCVYLNEKYIGDLYKNKEGEYRHHIPANYSMVYRDIKIYAEHQEVEDILLGVWVAE